MFQELLSTVKSNISTVSYIIKTNDILREVAFEDSSIIKQKSKDYAELITKFKNEIPRMQEWQIHEHCATVTRLYAIYERFVEDLLAAWIQSLPNLCPCYSELSERIRDTHQIGVGQLLLNLKKNRFKHLSIERVISGLSRGVMSEDKYELLPDAFLLHEQNLRKDILDKLFADAGISNACSWVEKHRLVKNVQLDVLIEYRNNAAHGFRMNDIIASRGLLQLCDFIETLCQALTELVTYQVIERKTIIGEAQKIGKITEWFKQPQAAVAVVGETTLSVGENIFLVGEAFCQLARIEGIQINGDPNNQVKTNSGVEVGLKFNIEAKKGLLLYKML